MSSKSMSHVMFISSVNVFADSDVFVANMNKYDCQHNLGKLLQHFWGINVRVNQLAPT